MKKTTERPKIIRDAFTIPESDYALIEKAQTRAQKAGLNVTKSEAVRAGLIALDAMSDTALVRTLQKVERIKTGRPKVKRYKTI